MFIPDYKVKKQADFTHVKRSFVSDLYKAKSDIKSAQAGKSSPLTDSVTTYLEKCFSYALYQNKNDEAGLKQAYRNQLSRMRSETTACVMPSGAVT